MAGRGWKAASDTSKQMPDTTTIDDGAFTPDSASGGAEVASASPIPKAMARKAPKAVSASATVIPDDGFTPDNLKGSVFESPSNKVARGANSALNSSGAFNPGPTMRTAAEMGVGTGLAIAADILAPEWTIMGGALKAGKLVGQAIAGAITPYAQAHVARALGEPVADPSFGDAIRGAAINVGMSGLGQVVSPTNAKGVAPEFEGATPGTRTPNQAKTALFRREVLKQEGMSDADIDKWYARVSKDPAELDQAAHVATVARDMGDMYTKIDQSTKGQFNQKFASFPYQQNTIPSAPLAQGIDGITSKAPVQARDSSVYKFLQEKSQQFGGSSRIPADVDRGFVQQSGGNPELLQRIRENYQKTTPAAAPQSISLGELRQRITESYENEPRNATPAEKSMMVQYRQMLRQHFDSSMQAAGASPEQLADIKDTYRSYGDAVETLRKLDPRNERFGTEASNALFGGMIKSPDDGLQLVRMVKQADIIHPGTFTQFKQGFISHLLEQAQDRAKGGGVMQETRNLAAIQRDIYNATGGTKSGPTMLAQIFDGPLRSPDKLAKVIGKLTEPKPNWDDLAAPQKALEMMKGSGATNWILRYAMITGFGSMIVGGSTPVGISKLMSQHPLALTASLGLFMLSGAAGRAFLGSDSHIAQAYMDAVLSGKTADWQKFIQTGSSIAGGTLNGALNLPQQQQPPPQSFTP